jgi:hypothetical protein
MNYKIISCALLLSAGMLARADALNKQHVSADAKWLVHVDCDYLRQTKVGEFLFNRFLAPKIAEVGASFKLDASNLVQRISSLTAYGTDFKKGPDANGVLLINSDAETQKALEGLLVAQMLADTNGPVQKISEADAPALYSFGGQVFIAPQKGGPIVISKAEDQVETARELLAGKGQSLAASKNLQTLAPASDSFFFVAAAEALELPKLPAEAKILQMAEGVRVALGEKAERVFLDLGLRAKTSEVTKEIQQVIEGMVALVKISQAENTELMDLAKSTKVTSSNQLVSLNIEYPANKVIARLNEELSDKPIKKAQKAKAKGKAKAKKEPPKAEEDEKDQAPPSKDNETKSES